MLACVLSYSFPNNSFAALMLIVLVIFFSFLSNNKKLILQFPFCIDHQ